MRVERALFFCSMGWGFPLPAVTAASSLGCANASDQVQGGDPLFGTASLSPARTADGGLLDASTQCQPGGEQGGHNWTDLYACYFGPTGVVSCESQSTCHGAGSDLGAHASNYVCGPTQSDCYQGMLAGALVTGSAADPQGSLLHIVLCKDPSAGSGMGQMPLNCPPGTWLLSGDLARIDAWIKEGAPNN